MFNFFKKRDKVTDISWLGIDIHSHILPGIDDGSKTIEQSYIYVQRLYDLGFESLFFTPHVFTDLYPNTPETIIPVLKTLTEDLKQQGRDYKLGAAAEYMIDSSFVISKDLLCLPNKHILIEMSYLSESPNIEDIIFKLQVEGYRIILAHPERYNFYHRNLQRYDRLHEMGCLFQLNLLSIVGYYGREVQQAAKYLIEKKMYDVAGTDLHHDKHLELLERTVKNGDLYDLIGHYEFKNKELFEV